MTLHLANVLFLAGAAVLFLGIAAQGVWKGRLKMRGGVVGRATDPVLYWVRTVFFGGFGIVFLLIIAFDPSV
jgi:hypothetical protein